MNRVISTKLSLVALLLSAACGSPEDDPSKDIQGNGVQGIEGSGLLGIQGSGLLGIQGTGRQGIQGTGRQALAEGASATVSGAAVAVDARLDVVPRAPTASARSAR